MIHKTKYITLIILILYGISSFSQGEKNIWHFGDHAGLDFNSGSPVAISGFVNTFEGSSSIADAGGNFLFSTDGIHVYDRLGTIMPGCGTGLLGHSSSTISSLIVPAPCSDHLYYIFCTDAQAGYPFFGSTGFGGLSYSIVDISLRGGLGDIISLNNVLLTPTAEKVCAIKHHNGRDIWIITHGWGNNRFYSFLLTPYGISAPTITNIGSIYRNPIGIIDNISAIGYITASLDGKKIACAILGIDRNNIELFSFDNRTGELYDFRTILTEGYAYGLAFSPDSKILYATFEYSSFYPYGQNISQWDISATDISSTRHIIDSLIDVLGITLGPDNKIYIASGGGPNIHAINNPNSYGTGYDYCNFCIPLGTGLSRIGLPSMVCFNDINNINPIEFNDTFVCNDSIELILDSFYFNVYWSNGVNGIRNVIRTNGEYWVRASDSCHTIYDTFSVRLSIRNIIPDDTLHLCNDSTPIVLELSSDVFNILWSTGSTLRNISILSPGHYWVRAEDSCGIFYDSFTITNIYTSVFSIGSDTTICSGASINIHANHTYSSYLWSNGSTATSISVHLSGIYVLTVTTYSGCVLTDSLFLNIYPSPILNLGNDTNICIGDTLRISIPNEYSSILWQDLSNTNSILISNPNQYHVQVVDSFGCIESDTINIRLFPVYRNILGEDILKCYNTIINFHLDSSLSDIHWNDSSTARNYDALEAGIYTVTMRDTNGCLFGDTITLTNRPIIPIHLNYDTIKCWYDNINLIVTGVPSGRPILWQDGVSTGLIRNINTPATYIATYYDVYGCASKDTQVVKNYPISKLSLIPLINKCTDSIVNISAPSNFISYQWSNGEHSPIISTNNAGWYYLQVVDSYDCIYSDSTYVQNKLFNSPLLGSNQTLCIGETLVLSPGNYEHYLWNIGDTISTITINNSGYYTVYVSNGCDDSILGVQINFINCEDRIAIPTAFSPNGDGINDLFFPHFDFFYTLEEFSIYNRWGEKVYSSIDTPWDGTYKGREQGTNTFVYQVVLHNNFKNTKVYKQGNITILK